jgi:hypothetical protein
LVSLIACNAALSHVTTTEGGVWALVPAANSRAHATIKAFAKTKPFLSLDVLALGKKAAMTEGGVDKHLT